MSLHSRDAEEGEIEFHYKLITDLNFSLYIL